MLVSHRWKEGQGNLSGCYLVGERQRSCLHPPESGEAMDRRIMNTGLDTGTIHVVHETGPCIGRTRENGKDKPCVLVSSVKI